MNHFKLKVRVKTLFKFFPGNVLSGVTSRETYFSAKISNLSIKNNHSVSEMKLALNY